VPDQKDSNAREFASVLLDIGGGRLHARLSDLLAEITAAVKETGKKGLLTLKIEVKPVPRADNGTLIVTGSATAKAPESDEDSPSSIFFADDDGSLSRSDPRQPTLPFREATR
jgi:hypothetical protein